MTLQERRELAQRLRAIPLEHVLRLSGAQPDRHDRHKWHTPVGMLSVTGAKFMNWNRAAGGGGAIDLVIHLHHLDFSRALFLMRGKQNLPVGAELRGTTQCHWRGLSPGSQKDLGCFAIPAEADSDAWPADRRIILCESAIDAISCFALHPQSRCLSTAGARPNPHWLGPLLNQGCEIWCGFDADATGDDMARAMIALHPTIKRLRPSQHDWNDQLAFRTSSSCT